MAGFPQMPGGMGGGQPPQGGPPGMGGPQAGGMAQAVGQYLQQQNQRGTEQQIVDGATVQFGKLMQMWMLQDPELFQHALQVQTAITRLRMAMSKKSQSHPPLTSSIAQMLQSSPSQQQLQGPPRGQV